MSIINSSCMIDETNNAFSRQTVIISEITERFWLRTRVSDSATKMGIDFFNEVMWNQNLIRCLLDVNSLIFYELLINLGIGAATKNKDATKVNYMSSLANNLIIMTIYISASFVTKYFEISSCYKCVGLLLLVF